MDFNLVNEDFFTYEGFDGEDFDLIITSPPYNMGKAYEKDMTRFEYVQFLAKFICECHRLAGEGGRFCLNLPLESLRHGESFPVASEAITIAKRFGWKYKHTIIWNNSNIFKRTAWGSWLSASAPNITSPVEVILVFYKGDKWKKPIKGESTISKEEFMSWTTGVWTFPGQSKKAVGGHPAPFPLELPSRCIKLFSYKGDKVFDPFAGSGTTLVAAKSLGRRGYGCELFNDYYNYANERISGAGYAD